MPARSKDEAQKLIKFVHPEYRANATRWRWLLDSYEGGSIYRDAVYGTDASGLPLRNLLRHKREDPPGQSINSTTYVVEGLGAINLADMRSPDDYAQSNNYESRRAQTPPPDLVGRAIRRHLSRIFAHDVTRVADGSDMGWLTTWWEDVDGIGTPMDAFVRKMLAPLLMAMGQIDIVVDHPAAPDGVEMRSRADEIAYGMDAIILGYYLPENVVWWRLDHRREYRELLVREWIDGDGDGGRVEVYRHWESDGSTVYDCEGEVVSTTPHPYGRPPVRRLFASRMVRTTNVGKSDYESIAFYQRSIYNRTSELIVADKYQAFPIIQVPGEMIEDDGTVTTGPDALTKMQGSPETGYFGIQIVDFPTTGSDSIRTNIDRDQDQADRDAALTKPAGATAGTVSQSGISKDFDFQEGNALLSNAAEMLAECERRILEIVALVYTNGKPAKGILDGVQISYPKEFDLYNAETQIDLIGKFNLNLASAESVPGINLELFSGQLKQMRPGLSEDQYREMDRELEAYFKARQESSDAMREAMATGAESMGAARADSGDGGNATDQGGDGGEPDDPTEPIMNAGAK